MGIMRSRFDNKPRSGSIFLPLGLAATSGTRSRYSLMKGIFSPQ